MRQKQRYLKQQDETQIGLTFRISFTKNSFISRHKDVDVIQEATTHELDIFAPSNPCTIYTSVFYILLQLLLHPVTRTLDTNKSFVVGFIIYECLNVIPVGH